MNSINKVPPEQRRNDDPCGMPGCSNSVNTLKRRVDDHTRELQTLKTLLEENNRKTSEVLDIVSLARSFFKVLGWLGNVIKALIAVGAPIVAFAYWLKTGDKP